MTNLTPTILTGSEHQDYAERAAILEHEAGMSREAAEQEALRLVLAKRQWQRQRYILTKQ